MLRKTLTSLFYVERAITPDASTHRTYLWITIVLLAGPFLLSVRPGAEHSLGFFGLQLPPLCASKYLFHTECPGCGLTRAFVLLTHGQFRESLRCHRAGILVYAFFLYQLFFRVALLRKPDLCRSEPLTSFQHFSALTTIAALIINWCAALLLGSNGS
ncbi:MAG TPA: DUF2752 domain-containing protein [Planctomycetota bacterium]|jgi:hypothetical protein